MLNSWIIDFYAAKHVYSSMVIDTIILVIEIFSSVIQGTPLGLKVPGVTEVRRLLTEHRVKTISFWQNLRGDVDQTNAKSGKPSYLCLTHFFLVGRVPPSAEHRISVPPCLVSPPPPHARWGGFSLSLSLSGLGFDPKHHDPRSRLFTDQFWGGSVHRSPVDFYQLPFPRTNWIWPSMCCLNFAFKELFREAEY